MNINSFISLLLFQLSNIVLFPNSLYSVCVQAYVCVCVCVCMCTLLFMPVQHHLAVLICKFAFLSSFLYDIHYLDIHVCI